MRGISPAQWNTPLPITMEKNNPINAAHDGRSWRRIPQPHSLSTDREKTS